MRAVLPASVRLFPLGGIAPDNLSGWLKAGAAGLPRGSLAALGFMSARRAVMFLLTIGSLVGAPNSLATTIVGETVGIELPKKDRAILETMVCREKYGVSLGRVDARLYKLHTHRSVSAQIFCAPHGLFHGKPMRYFSSSEREQKGWTCEEAGLEVFVDVGRREVAFSFGDSDPEWAYGTLVKLGATGWITDRLTSEEDNPRCWLQRATVPEWFTVHCLGWEITLSTWCPQGECPRVVSAREGSGW